MEISPPGYSDDDDGDGDGDDDCDNNDDNSVEPYIPSVISDIHCEEYRSKGNKLYINKTTIYKYQSPNAGNNHQTRH